MPLDPNDISQNGQQYNRAGFLLSTRGYVSRTGNTFNAVANPGITFGNVDWYKTSASGTMTNLNLNGPSVTPTGLVKGDTVFPIVYNITEALPGVTV